MTDKIRIPSLAELKKAGYSVYVKHNRMFKIAYKHPLTKRLITKVVMGDWNLIPPFKNCDLSFDPILSEMLPKGGMTEVFITDKTTSAEFYGFSKCYDSENYNKKEGLSKAINRAINLMLVLDGKDGFEMRIKV